MLFFSSIKSKITKKIKRFKFFILLFLILLIAVSILFMDTFLKYLAVFSIIGLLFYLAKEFLSKFKDLKESNRDKLIVNISHSIESPQKLFNITTTNLYRLKATIEIEAYIKDKSISKYSESIERSITKDDITESPILYLENQLKIIIENSISRFTLKNSLPHNISVIKTIDSYGSTKSLP
jgi:hypothetical protein